MSGSRSWFALAAAALLVLGGCGFTTDGKLPSPTSRVHAASVKLTNGKQTMLVATSKAGSGLFFTRPPYDLNGAWRTEVTCGIFQPPAIAASTGTSFGLEADLRGPTKQATQYYGVYARYFTTPMVGLQVYAVSHVTNQLGQTFFTNATTVDLVVQSSGTTVTFLARDAAVGGAYTTIATTPLATPLGAHQPGFGMFQAGKGASIGFTNFRVPANGSPQTPVSAEQDALNAVYQTAFLVLEAAYAVDGPVLGPMDVLLAQSKLNDATISLAAARAKIEGLAKAPPTPKDRALAAVTKMEKALEGARTAFQKKGEKAVGPFLNAAKAKMFTAAWKATDALIPADLRAALPGNGLGK